MIEKILLFEDVHTMESQKEERNEEMKQEKLDMLLDLLEYLENCTEVQKDALLDDAEVKELYQQMVETREALDYQKSKEEMAMPSVSEEWEKLKNLKSEGRRTKSDETTFDGRSESQLKCSSNGSISSKQDEEKTPSSKFVALWPPMRKVAVVVVVLIVSGIAFAAIHLATRSNQAGDSSQIEQAIAEKDSLKAPTALVSQSQEEKADTTAANKLPLVYENVELQDILAPIAEHFHVSVSYQNESARHIRLYLQLTENMGLEEVIELMNHFEKVNIRHEGKSLIVE